MDLGCPNCISKGKNCNKIVKRGSFYFCENLTCDFYADKTSFENLLNSHLKKIDNSNLIIENKFKSNFETIEDQIECPICKISAKINKIVKRGNYYFCEDLNCFFVADDLIITDLVEKNRNIIKTNDIIDKLSIKEHSVFNWLSLSSKLQVNYKILSIIILNFDFNQIENQSRFIDIKNYYNMCENSLINNKKEQFNLLSIDFISKLSIVIDNQCENREKKECNELLSTIIRKYYNFIDLSNSCVVDYKINMICTNKKCVNNRLNVCKSDYLVTIDDNREGFIMADCNGREIRYTVNCSLCKGIITKSIEFTKVPHFVMLDCPYGYNNKEDNIKSFVIIGDNGESLSLVGVVEVSDKDKTDFTVHFRNIVGWYKLANKGNCLCSPNQTLEINNNKNVRLLIYGTVPNSSKYDKIITPEEYISEQPSIIISEDDVLKKVNIKRKSTEINLCSAIKKPKIQIDNNSLEKSNINNQLTSQKKIDSKTNNEKSIQHNFNPNLRINRSKLNKKMKGFIELSIGVNEESQFNKTAVKQIQNTQLSEISLEINKSDCEIINNISSKSSGISSEFNNKCKINIKSQLDDKHSKGTFRTPSSSSGVSSMEIDNKSNNNNNISNNIYKARQIVKKSVILNDGNRSKSIVNRGNATNIRRMSRLELARCNVDIDSDGYMAHVPVSYQRIISERSSRMSCSQADNDKEESMPVINNSDDRLINEQIGKINKLPVCMMEKGDFHIDHILTLYKKRMEKR